MMQGEFCVGQRGAPSRLDGWLQGQLQQPVDIADQFDGHGISNVFWDVLNIAAVVRREQDGGESGPVSGQHLLLHPTDRENPTLQCDFAGHGEV